VQQTFKAIIVQLILNGETEKALGLLAQQYAVNAPKIRVGLPKGRKKKALGCYNAKSRTISILNSDTLREPFVVLHEFYHHLRANPDSRHKGTEKHANAFAKKFIQAYKSALVEGTGNN
jgi:Zn-dependent peptidase ImmA (M78 family)